MPCCIEAETATEAYGADVKYRRVLSDGQTGEAGRMSRSILGVFLYFCVRLGLGDGRMGERARRPPRAPAGAGVKITPIPDLVKMRRISGVDPGPGTPTENDETCWFSCGVGTVLARAKITC